MSKTRMNRRVFRFAIVLIVSLVMLFAFVGCGKKDKAAEAAPTTVTTTTATTTKAEPATPAPTPAAPTTESVVVEEAPVEEVVIEEIPELVGTVTEIVEPATEDALEIVKEVASSLPVIAVPDSYPVVLSADIGGETFSIEAYDGYGFVHYPESYTEEDVDAFLDPLVNANSEISDYVGWSVEDPGFAIIAYPFGLTPAEIASYSAFIANNAN